MTDPEEGGGERTQLPQGRGPAEDRASALRVITVAGLLLLLAAAGSLLLSSGDGTLEPDDFFAEVFAGVSLPLDGGLKGGHEGGLEGGLEVDEGRRLPTGERFVRFAASTPAPDGPVELTIVEFPRARGEAVLKDQLTGLSFESSGMRSGGMGSSGGRGGQGRPGAGGSPWGKKEPTYKLREKGTLRWHGFDADFARLWHPDKAPARGGADTEPGAGFGGGETSGGYETIRVNLSTGGRCLLGYLRFQEGHAPTGEQAAAILAGLRPVDQ